MKLLQKSGELMYALNLLRDNGIRPSGVRIQILEYILNHKTHPTIEEIYECLSEINPTLSKTSVYNTTKLFSEHGLIKMVTIDGQQARFDGDVSYHGHFRCSSCNKIYDFPLTKPLKEELDGFEIDTMDVYYAGICKTCNKK